MISMRIFYLMPLLILSVFELNAQSILSRNVSLNIEKQRLGTILQLLETKGDFKFAYHSKILPADSLVSLRVSNMSIAQTLDELLGQQYEFRQSGNFVVLRYAPRELTLFINESGGNPELYTIKGQVVDKVTGKPILDASVYEKQLLVSAITDQNGYFSLRFKNAYQAIALTVSKENYKSSVTHFLAEVNITNRSAYAEKFIGGEFPNIEHTWLGRKLVTTKQKIQSINIGGFISKAPYQVALVPGLNSHGSLSGQVVNKFSFNAIGAYSAGVDGAEVGLIFNIDKSDVRFLQFAGAFNLVGGNLKGVQIGGMFNVVGGEANAAQISLGYNHIGKDFEGFQVGGLYNRVGKGLLGVQFSTGLNTIGDDFNGIQIGALNIVGKETRGVQMAVGANLVGGKASGLQIGGLANINYESSALSISPLLNLNVTKSSGFQVGAINYTKKLTGLQLGILNISNDNSGYSLGLINIALKGFHKFYLGTNETTDFSFAYKGGNSHFYNILKFGANRKSAPDIYTFGLGFGTSISIYKAMSVSPELSSQYVYQGSWAYTNLLQRLELPLTIKVNDWLSVVGGPSLNIYYSKQQNPIGRYGLLQDKHRHYSFANPRYSGWLGWSFGVNIL